MKDLIKIVTNVKTLNTVYIEIETDPLTVEAFALFEFNKYPAISFKIKAYQNERTIGDISSLTQKKLPNVHYWYTFYNQFTKNEAVIPITMKHFFVYEDSINEVDIIQRFIDSYSIKELIIDGYSKNPQRRIVNLPFNVEKITIAHSAATFVFPKNLTQLKLVLTKTVPIPTGLPLTKLECHSVEFDKKTDLSQFPLKEVNFTCISGKFIFPKTLEIMRCTQCVFEYNAMDLNLKKVESATPMALEI